MGGELLLVALGGCFLSNLLAAIRAREAPIQEVRVVVEGTLAEAPLPPGPPGGPGQDRGQGPSGEARDRGGDRKSTRLNSSHTDISRMPSSA